MAFKTFQFGELAQNISRRFDFKKSPEVVFINTGDIIDGSFLVNEKVTSKGLPGQAKKAIVEGDILYSEIRPGNKRHLLVKGDVSDYVVSTKFMVIECDKTKIIPEYLYLVLTSPECEAEFKVIADSRSGTFPQITFDSVAYYPIPTPDIDVQKKISKIVYAYDDKIALNTQINQTLESMAQALFKSWFVDFDPVKAKMEARAGGGSDDAVRRAAMAVISNKSSDELDQFEQSNPDAYDQLAETADLFPESLVESELGLIPEGWEVSEIGDEVTVKGGATPSTKNPDFWDGGEINWTTPKDLSNLKDKVLTETERCITNDGLKKISSGLLPVGTVLLSSRAPVGYLALAKIPVAVNQGYIAMVCEKVLPPEFVLLWCESNMDEIKQRASGTTFQEISKRNFKPIKVVVPPTDVIDGFQSIIAQVFEMIKDNVLQSKALQETRDTLLPKLLSGEIDLSNYMKESK